MRSCSVGWRGLGVLLAASAAAQAADPPSTERLKAAAEEFDAGRRAYNARDYDTAAAHFENADRDAPAPEALRNAIRARSDARQPARAATLAAAALARYPADKATTKLARQVLAASEKQLHRLQIQCAPDCTLLIDGKLAPLPEGPSFLLYIDPGQHKIMASWPRDRNREQEIEGVAGKESSLSFEAPRPPPPPPATTPAPPPPPPPPPPPKGLPPAVFLSAAGLTAVLGGVTLWSGLDMRSSPGRDKVRADCAGKDASCPTYQEALRKQSRTNVLIAATSVSAVATGVLAYFTRWSSPASNEASARPVIVLQNGVTVGAEGTF